MNPKTLMAKMPRVLKTRRRTCWKMKMTLVRKLMPRQSLVLVVTGKRRPCSGLVGTDDVPPKRTCTGLIALVEPEDTGGVTELEMYAAFAAVAIAYIKAKVKLQQKEWHESEVKIPRSVRHVNAPPQYKEYWQGMKKETRRVMPRTC